MMNGFVADALGQRQPFGERRERLVVVALARQRQAVQEAAEQQREEQPAVARQLEAFSLEPRGLGVVTVQFLQQTRPSTATTIGAPHRLRRC